MEEEERPLTARAEKLRLTFKLAYKLEGLFSQMSEICMKSYLKVKKIDRKYYKIEKEKRILEQKAASKHKAFEKEKKKKQVKKSKQNEKNEKQQGKEKQKKKPETQLKPQEDAEILEQPPAPYFIFLASKKAEMKAQFKHMSTNQTVNLMKKLWERLSPQERKPFLDDYEKRKLEYEKARAKIKQKYYHHRTNKLNPILKETKDFLDELDDIQ